jgi:hypothetical protein
MPTPDLTERVKAVRKAWMDYRQQVTHHEFNLISRHALHSKGFTKKLIMASGRKTLRLGEALNEAVHQLEVAQGLRR